MLAALIATRSVIPPPPSIITYGNQLVAVTTTFLCITLTNRAAFLPTNPVQSYQLLFSTQGNESILSQLDRFYYNLISPLASYSPAYLSTNIASVVATAKILNGIIQSLSVTSANSLQLIEIQTRMGIALRVLNSLAIPITLNFT